MTPVAYVTLAANATVTLSGTPSLTFTPTSAFTSLPNSTPAYLALYDPSRASSGWSVFAGPIPLSNTQAAAFASTAVLTTLQAGSGKVIALFVSSSTIPTPTSTNPIDDPTFFVTQQYRDFLNRDPDQAGLNFWVNQINSCNGDAQCVDIKRQNVSSAFFLSREFQETGYYVIRLQRVAFGRMSADSTKRISYSQFSTDLQAVRAGFIDGQSGADAVLEQNKTAYAQSVAGSNAFTAIYPTTTPAGNYVDALFASAGVTPQGTERQVAINAFGAGDTAGRAAALRSVAELGSVRSAELNSAFVLLEYFGYLRRNPTDPPDNSDAGYQAYLNKLNQFNGDYIKSEMVRSFITSAEYRGRFGPP